MHKCGWQFSHANVPGSTGRVTICVGDTFNSNINFNPFPLRFTHFQEYIPAVQTAPYDLLTRQDVKNAGR